MSFAGRVHSNGSVYAGGNVVFDRNISCVGGFYNRRKETGARNGTGVQLRFGDDDAGDAVTVLSRGWHDAWCLPDWAAYRTGGAAALGGTVYPLSRRTPVETTVNAVVMTGIVPTVGTSYSGGLENVFRFLEGWRGHNCNFDGSILCMWDSEESNAPWPGVDVVYGPPNRNWGYSRMEPPGIPNLFDVRETEWSRVAWGDVDWDAAEWE